MKRANIFYMTISGAMLTGCGAKWTVSDQRFFRYENKDVRFAGTVQMTEEARQLIHTEKGADFEARLYDDGYSTVIYETKQRLGEDLEDADSKNTKEIFTLPITQIRLGGTVNSYPVFCAEVRMDDSNVSEWTRIGCTRYTDDALDSPTGGLGKSQNPV